MRLLGRAFLFVFGLLVAIPAGLVTLAIGVALEPAARELVTALGVAGFESFLVDLLDEGEAATASGAALVRLWVMSATLLILPPTLVALVGEIAGTRSFAWYGFGCGALTAAVPWLSRGSERLAESSMLAAEGRITALLFVIGAVAGLTYWLIAGRSASVDES